LEAGHSYCCSHNVGSVVVAAAAVVVFGQTRDTIHADGCSVRCCCCCCSFLFRDSVELMSLLGIPKDEVGDADSVDCASVVDVDSVDSGGYDYFDSSTYYR